MRGRRPGARTPKPGSGTRHPLWKRRIGVAGPCLAPPDTWLRHSRKEVIQPQVPLRLPCYDFTPVADLTVVGYPPGPRTGVGAPPSGQANSHGVTGGVYKARERIHRGVLIRDY